MSAGLTLLRRRGEVYAVKHLRLEARKLRSRAGRQYHAEPEVIASYLTLAYWLDDAADTLTAAMKARRAADGEEP